MHERKAQTDDDAGEVGIFLLARCAENGKHEHEGQNRLDDEGDLETGSVGRTVDVVCAETVGVAEDEQQRPCAGYSTDKLRSNVAAKVLNAHAAGEQHAQGDGGVYVAAGHVADGVRHGDDDETEGERRCDVARIGEKATGDGGDAAGEEYQHTGADELGDVLFDAFHLHTSVIKIL